MLQYAALPVWFQSRACTAMPEEQREETVTRIGEIIGAGETPDELPVHVTVGLTSLA
jgi:hypothetical protein